MRQPPPESFCRHAEIPGVSALTALEMRVVRLAGRDAAHAVTTRRHSKLARFVAWFAGFEQPQPLADIRLETLRRFACLIRNDDGRASAVANNLVGFGFSEKAISEAAAMACR